MYLLHTCYEQVVKRNIDVLYEHFVVRLAVKDERCAGVVVLNLHNGEFQTIGAKAVIFATGGHGRVWNITSNAHSYTGDGVGITLRRGIPAEDMEFFQFHPTG